MTLFENRVASTMSEFMGHLIDERESYKESLPMFAKSLKAFYNSVCGYLGYSNSHLYNPTCVAAITTVGRHCVKLINLEKFGGEEMQYIILQRHPLLWKHKGVNVLLDHNVVAANYISISP